MKSGWKKYLLYGSLIVVIGGIIFMAILAGYSVDWTGFGSYPNPKGEIERGKTLWDWMDLLIIPLALALGAIYLNREEKKLEREVAQDRQREAALQAYIDKISELLLDRDLQTTEDNKVRDVARTRTIIIMRLLNKDRNDLVIQFLREAKLITNENSILNGADMEKMDLQDLDLDRVFLQATQLIEANLERSLLFEANLDEALLIAANLKDADLGRVNLQQAILDRANLTRANLSDADLTGAGISRADLIDAYLTRANLTGAILDGANLTGAILSDANLSRANLTKAKVTHEQLIQAKTLKGATMPDGTIHE